MSRTLLTLVLIAASLVAVAGLALTPQAVAGSQAWFRTVCAPSHTLADDPIVFPNRPGAAHHHDFYGNTTTNAYSTYTSLRAGSTTCRRAADKAAYWVPSMHVDGEMIEPNGFTAYYRAGNKRARSVKAPPADLRVIADRSSWRCTFAHSGWDAATQGCPGSNLELVVNFPDCWDGNRLDSADHRSHMAYSVRAGLNNVCPASHPVPLPRIEFIVSYGWVSGPFTLSSGAPDTAHADFLNAWDQATLEALVRTCINGGLLSGLTC